MTQPTPHHCTVYCADGEHCDLIYTDRAVDPQEVAQLYGYYRGLRVMRVEPATEAAPLATIPEAHRDPLPTPATRGTHAYLVWWR